VRHGTAAATRPAQHGGDTSNQWKVVTMRLVRILLVVLAVVAVGLAGWALGARDSYNAPATADPVPAASDPAPEAAVTTPAPAPREQATPDPTTRPAPAPPRPRIVGFGSEPVLPREGAFWRLSPGAGLVTFVLDAQHATRVEFWLTPTGSSVSDLSRKIGQDTNGRDGWLFNWRYPDGPILGHLTVKAIGPGGTDEQTVGVYHPDTEQP
jgi:hypothetical protein